MENIFHLFKCAEDILERVASGGVRGGDGPPPEGMMNEVVCGEASTLLNQAVRHLSSSTPLFCHYAWKLMALVDIVRVKNKE